jgi:hypothetical protein
MSEEKQDDDQVVRGSGNFLADQGIADPDEFRVKTHLCHEIATISEQRGLVASDVAGRVGESVEDVERMQRSRHDGYEL